MESIRIRFINNDGGGLAKEFEIPLGMRVGPFIERELPGYNPNSFQIRVRPRNGQPYTPTEGDMFKDGDQLSLIPTKMDGACL